MKERKSNKRRILIVRIVLIVLVSVLLGSMLYQINVRNLTGDQMPMPLGFGLGVVMSGSMEPELSVDDLIFVTKASEYEVGDVVVFQSKGMLVVHKIISIDGETVVTQGTANNTPDDPMELKALKGKVRFHIGGVGKVVDAIKSPMGTAVILLIAAALLVLSYKKEKKSDNEELDEIRKEIERLKAEQGDATEAATPEAAPENDKADG